MGYGADRLPIPMTLGELRKLLKGSWKNLPDETLLVISEERSGHPNNYDLRNITDANAAILPPGDPVGVTSMILFDRGDNEFVDRPHQWVKS